MNYDLVKTLLTKHKQADTPALEEAASAARIEYLNASDHLAIDSQDSVSESFDQESPLNKAMCAQDASDEEEMTDDDLSAALKKLTQTPRQTKWNILLNGNDIDVEISSRRAQARRPHILRPERLEWANLTHAPFLAPPQMERGRTNQRMSTLTIMWRKIYDLHQATQSDTHSASAQPKP
jgi:hypothetical protein